MPALRRHLDLHGPWHGHGRALGAELQPRDPARSRPPRGCNGRRARSSGPWDGGRRCCRTSAARCPTTASPRGWACRPCGCRTPTPAACSTRPTNTASNRSSARACRSPPGLFWDLGDGGYPPRAPIMMRTKTNWLLTGLLCLTLWPAPAHAQSPELLDTYNRFSELDAEGRYHEAIPFAEKAVALVEREFGPDDPKHRHPANQPGGAVSRPRQIRRGRAAVSAGAGDPRECVRPRSPGRGHGPQQPGCALSCSGPIRRG